MNKNLNKESKKMPFFITFGWLIAMVLSISSIFLLPDDRIKQDLNYQQTFQINGVDYTPYDLKYDMEDNLLEFSVREDYKSNVENPNRIKTKIIYGEKKHQYDQDKIKMKTTLDSQLNANKNVEEFVKTTYQLPLPKEFKDMYYLQIQIDELQTKFNIAEQKDEEVIENTTMIRFDYRLAENGNLQEFKLKKEIDVGVKEFISEQTNINETIEISKEDIESKNEEVIVSTEEQKQQLRTDIDTKKDEIKELENLIKDYQKAKDEKEDRKEKKAIQDVINSTQEELKAKKEELKYLESLVKDNE